MLHGFVGFSPGAREQGDEHTVDGSAIWLARLDAWIATFLTRLEDTEMHGGHLQKLCTDS